MTKKEIAKIARKNAADLLRKLPSFYTPVELVSSKNYEKDKIIWRNEILKIANEIESVQPEAPSGGNNDRM